MKLIKLTNDGKTKNNTKWEIGKTVSISNGKRKPKLCLDGVLHAYESIEQALVTKINHGYESDNQLKIFEVEGDIELKEYDKVGSYELTPIKEVALPDWYLNEGLRKKIFVRFACYCALEVIDIFEEKYPNDNRPRKAIEEAMKYGSDGFDKNVAVCAAYTARAAVYNADAYAAADTDNAAADIVYFAAVSAYADINITKLMKKAIGDFV